MGIVLDGVDNGRWLMIYDFIKLTFQRLKKFYYWTILTWLVEQMYSKDFKNYGWNDINDYVGLIYAGKMDYKIIITDVKSTKIRV